MRSWPIFIAVLAMTQGATAQVPPDPANGRKLATELCTNCHLVSREQTGPVLDGIPSFMAIAGWPGQDEAKIQNILLNPPHPVMPTPPLNERQRADVAAYILSLKN